MICHRACENIIFTKNFKGFKYVKMADNNKNKKRKKISPKYLENAGLAYLGRFSASSAHFKKVMTKKINRSMEDHPDQDYRQCLDWLDETVKRFEEWGYLNDSQYAKGLARSLRFKGQSQFLAIQKMTQKGLDKNLSTKHLLEIDTETLDNFDDIKDADYISALRLCKKRRIGPFRIKPIEESHFSQKELASLARGGFSFDIAQQALETNPDVAIDLLGTAY